MTTHRTACILCSRNCGLEVEAHDGHLTKIRGDEGHPVSKGYLCQKAARLDYYQNHDDRLTFPLRRRSDGTFERISWDAALQEIAAKLLAIKVAHGGKAFAFYGGGGQGNHLGGMYANALLQVMGSPYLYSALAQEKTGDFWVNGKLFGRQTCHTTEDVEHADFVLFIGTNPWQAHGIPNARETLKSIKKIAVIDPRRTETAKLADIHLQLRPGTDAFLLTALAAILVRENLVDRSFLARHTTGFEDVRAVLEKVPVERYVERAGVPLAGVQKLAREFAAAPAACVRVDLGIQQSLHSTLNSYLEKLLYLLTGNFGKKGGNNFHSFFLPLIGHSGEGADNIRTTAANMKAIGKLYPPNILPGEIDNDRPDRVRALFVDSANPMVSGADTAAYRKAFAKLELLVAVDVAMTETARLAHYILPAATQLEKHEATGFNLEFPRNAFHLRKPIFEPRGECLPEPEIYSRLLQKMGVLPAKFPVLEKIAALDRKAPQLGLYQRALEATLLARPKLRKAPAHVAYLTLGKSLSAPAAAVLWFLAHGYVQKHEKAVRKAGHKGKGRQLGEALFQAIVDSPTATVVSEHEYEDTWSFLRHPDRKIHLDIPEMLRALDELRDEAELTSDYPLILIAGERRAYNANTIYRNPAWRKMDPDGALAIHPKDAEKLGLSDGDKATCRSTKGSVEVTVKLSDAIREGVVTLPHGYGLSYQGGPPAGPILNELTDADHRDPIAATPFHKYVPVVVERR